MINNIKIDTHLVVIFPVETDRDYIENITNGWRLARSSSYYDEKLQTKMCEQIYKKED